MPPSRKPTGTKIETGACAGHTTHLRLPEHDLLPLRQEAGVVAVPEQHPLRPRLCGPVGTLEPRNHYEVPRECLVDLEEPLVFVPQLCTVAIVVLMMKPRGAWGGQGVKGGAANVRTAEPEIVTPAAASQLHLLPPPRCQPQKLP